MLDPRSLEAQRDEILESCRRRGVDVDLDAAIAEQHSAAAIQTELNELNRLRNEHQGAGRGVLSAEEREAHVAEGRRLKQQSSELDRRLTEAQSALRQRLLEIPNLVHPDVPVGGEDAFVELRRSSTPRDFGFEPRDHLEIGARLDLIDLEGGGRVAGQKWYFLKNELVVLDLALQRFALDVAAEEGFTRLTTPDVARREIVDALAFSPRGQETQIYSVADTDLDLIGTAEITLGGLHADAVLDEERLPLQLAGLSHCFRTEAGSHGRESRGLYRVHQFTKVEMFVFCRPEDSEATHTRLLAIEERIFQALEIPYRVIDVATGDLGAPAWRKYDIEGWFPSRGEGGDWGELTSTSNCTDYQARRLRTRFRRAGGKKTELVHTLNGTAVAVPRTLVALLENHQQGDGSVAVPKSLQPYAGFERIGPR